MQNQLVDSELENSVIHGVEQINTLKESQMPQSVQESRVFEDMRKSHIQEDIMQRNIHRDLKVQESEIKMR